MFYRQKREKVWVGWAIQIFESYHTTPSQVVLVVNNLPVHAGDVRDAGSIPGSGRSPGVEEMATHSSILAWEIPWTEEPGGLQSI